MNGIVKALTVIWISWVSRTLVQVEMAVRALSQNQCMGQTVPPAPAEEEPDSSDVSMASPVILPVLPKLSKGKTIDGKR